MTRPLTDPYDEFFAVREAMIERQIIGRDVHDPAVIRAMRLVPREAFVSARHRALAYGDTPLPIPAGQTISQPYVVALMLSKLRLKPEHCVLEIGTGSGYAAALLAHIVREVHTVERIEKLVAYARARLSALGYDNVIVHHGDGTLGWPPNAPYDAVVVAAGGPALPPALREQLKINGRLLMPIGRSERRQALVQVTRTGANTYDQIDLGAVAFVPLIGEEGW